MAKKVSKKVTKKVTKKKTSKKKETWPQVTKGSHLTVTKYEDGRCDLKWDWDALERDVAAALGK